MNESFLETWHKRGGKEKGRQDNAKKILLWQFICLESEHVSVCLKTDYLAVIKNFLLKVLWIKLKSS